MADGPQNSFQQFGTYGEAFGLRAASDILISGEIG